MAEAFSPANLTAIIVTLGFAAGLNVYATVFSLGVMARLHWVVLPAGLGGLTNPWVMGASGALFLMEFVADKVPGFDLVWNALHTFVRIPAAAVLAYAASTQLSPGMHVLVTALGAAMAAAAHGSKMSARLTVTPSPEPVSNIALSAGEDGAAIGLTWLALHHAVAAASIVCGLTVAGCWLVWWGVRRVRGGWAGFVRRWRGEKGAV